MPPRVSEPERNAPEPAPEPEPELSGLSLKGWAGGGRAEPASQPLQANDQAETDAALDLDAMT